MPASLATSTSDRTVISIDAPPDGAGVIVCFSHLRWSFVWQRPQHLLSRFAVTWPAYVVEEPEFAAELDEPRLTVSRHGNVTVLTPVIPDNDGLPYGFNHATNPHISELLTSYFSERELLDQDATVVTWYYTPMALGAEPRGLKQIVTIYDVMDELANFRGAPVALRENERELYGRADLVFTGGPSLYQTRIDRHPRVYCFPSGVDVDHFARASDVTVLPRDIAALPRPTLGFYGVLDERLDTDLIAGIAALRPEWQLVLIGPVVKISDDDLPKANNIHYLGKRDYAQLPDYLAGFDAAFLPFARNEATTFISPTKTLEYLAAGKPVVSTSIKDVVDLYGSAVEIADDPETFVATVERLWRESPEERATRRARALRLLTEHEWDSIAGNMLGLIEDAVAGGKPVGPSRRQLAGQVRAPASD